MWWGEEGGGRRRRRRRRAGGGGRGDSQQKNGVRQARNPRQGTRRRIYYNRLSIRRCK
jgi:hypothetical protein